MAWDGTSHGTHVYIPSRQAGLCPEKLVNKLVNKIRGNNTHVHVRFIKSDKEIKEQ